MAAIGTLPVLLATGIHASRPAASAVGKGGLYSCTTHGLLYQTDGSSWATWATLGAAASGSITASGYTQATARMLGRTTGSTGAIEEITVGTGLSLSAGSLTASASFPTTAHAECSAGVTLTANVMADATGVSVSLAAGTWDIVGVMTFQGGTAAAGYCLVYVRDGSNANFGSGRGYYAASNKYLTVPVMARVTPGSTTTYKLSGQAENTSDEIKQYANGTVVATMMTATRVA